MSANVALVIPAHNASSTIAYAIRSVLTGTRTVSEVAVYDDASTDKTCRVVESLGDQRIKLLGGRVNCGPGVSRDIAISAVSASWVAFVDADDACKPGRLEALMRAAVTTGADVVFDDALVCRDTPRGLVGVDRVHGKHAFGAHGGQPCLVTAERYISAPRLLIHAMVRTAFIREHGIRHSTRRFGEDAEFYLRLAYAGAKFCYVPQALYLYRVSRGSLTARTQDHSLMRKCLESCAAWPKWDEHAKAAFAAKITSLLHSEAAYAIIGALRAGRAMEAMRLAARDPAAISVLLRKGSRRIRQFTRALGPAIVER